MEEDTLARERITTEIDRNFFVEAAAGSGKTSSLVDRMIAMVAHGIEVGSICAITFTKAAAREFYGRFQKRLAEKLHDEKDETLRTRYEKALQNIDLCFMGTIDAFSNMLLHEHPLEAGMPSETAITEGDEAIPQYLTEYARIKRGEYPASLTEKYELFRTVHMQPDEVFAHCISSFTERREASFTYTPPSANPDVNTPYINWKNDLVSTLKALLSQPELTGTTKETTTIMGDLRKHIITLQKPWNGQVGNVLNALKKISGLRLAKGVSPQKIGTSLPQLFQEHIGRSGTTDYYYLETTDTAAYGELKKLQYAASMDFLVHAAGEIADEMRSKGTMTFHDALLTLRNMLKRDAQNGGKMIEHIASRHSYYLVDEFQDTDPLQAEVIFYLAAKKLSSEWTACVPRAGSLFIVGDPKQSIYRFRGADVSSFMRVRSLFTGDYGEVLTLSRNFRSTVMLKSWFNDVFSDMLKDNGDIQSAFHPIPIGADEADHAFTGVFRYQTMLGAYNSMADDPVQVEAVIRRLIGNPAVRLKNGEPPKYSDIMVIAYRKKQTAEIAKRLLAAGIPVRVEGKTDFADCPALTEAVRLFGAAADPTNAAAVFNALTSAAFGISQDCIRGFCCAGGRLNAFTEQAEILKKYPEIGAALAQIRQYANTGCASDSAALFECISDNEKLIAKAGSSSLEYYFYALELLRKLEKEGTLLSHSDAAEYLRGILAGSGVERCISLAQNDNRVLIANLHKVKGLQAPIVILADPRASDFKPELHMEHGIGRPECHVFSLSYRIDNITYKAAETDAYPVLYDKEDECMDAEKLRLLYVAATRAESILIIGDSIKGKDHFEQNPWKEFLSDSVEMYTKAIPENTFEIRPPAVREDGDQLYEDAKQKSVLNDTAAEGKTYQIVLPSRIKLNPVTKEEPEDVSEREPIDRNAALTGTLVHRLMECIVSGGIPADADALTASILREFDADPLIYAPLLQKVLKTMDSGGYPQENEVPQDLLAVLQNADAVYCEVPFCLRRGSDIMNGVIDLLYRNGDIWRIIDYKTNAESAGLDEKYSAQLGAYKEAVRSIIGADANADIYHIDV